MKTKQILEIDEVYLANNKSKLLQTKRAYKPVVNTVNGEAYVTMAGKLINKIKTK